MAWVLMMWALSVKARTRIDNDGLGDASPPLFHVKHTPAWLNVSGVAARMRL